MAKGERTIRNISRGNTKAYTVSKKGSNSFFNTFFVGNFDNMVIEEKQGHIHTLSEVIKNAQAINGDKCTMTIVTQCSDPNCPNPSEVYKEQTETRNHEFVRNAGESIGDGIIEYHTYCKYCGYEGPIEYGMEE